MNNYKKLFSFVAIILLSGNFFSYSQWIKKGGTGGLSAGESIAVDNAGNIYSTGVFICDLVFDGDTLFNTTCSDLTGIPQYDGFIVKYDGNGVLQWAQQIVGEKVETLSIEGISVDNAGNSYITGYYTGSLTFGGATTITRDDDALQDMFVARYLSDGTFDWVTNNFARGVNSFIQANAIATDASGNSFVAGMHHDTIVFDIDTLFPSLTQEFFIAKYNAAGNYQWVVSSIGDSSVSEAQINDIVLDGSNHFYVTGVFKDTVIIFPGDTLKSVSAESGLFVAKYTDPPALDWMVQEDLNGAIANGISLDKTFANVFVAGQYKGAATIGIDVLSPSGTDYAAFVAKYDNAGVFSWARNSIVNTGDSSATGRSVGVDEFGGVYLAGNFGKRNSNSSITSGAVTETGYQAYDGFVTKFDAIGNLKWIQVIGGNLNDDVRDIQVIDSSNVCIAGYFSIRARVDSALVTNDSTGGFNSYTAKMDVCPYYSADIVATGSTTLCREDSILLTATAGVGFTYQWQKNNILIPGAAASTYYANDSAEYRVIITNPSIPCIKYSLPIFIKVNPLPNVAVIKNDTTVFCTGENVRLSAPLGNKYQWLESGIIIPNDTNFSYTATTTGDYSVVARNSYGCIDTSIVTSVNVIPYPTAVVTPSSKFIICNGDSVTLNSNTDVTYKYQWLKNGAVLLNDTLPVYKAKTTGIFKIRISNELGCSTTSVTADTVTIIVTPPATIAVSGTTSYCSYQNSTLIANSGVGLYYIWERNGGALLPADTLSSYVPVASGNYVVRVRNGIGCEATSAITSITIEAQPSALIGTVGSASFCLGDSVLLNATVGAGYSYVWQRNGVSLPGVIAASYYAKQTGNFRVIITAPNTCSDTTASIVVTVNPIPNATLSALGITSFCIGDSVELRASSGSGFSYVWKLDGIVIGGATAVSYQAKLSGLYTVEITNSSNCVQESTGITVTVFTVPPATITSSGATTFCDGDSVILNANTGAGLNYVWRKNGFVLPSDISSSLKVKTSGNYTVQVSITSACTNTSTTTVVLVKANQKPIITINGTNISTSLFNTYQWQLNGSPISGANNQIYNAVVNGLYTVVVENANNCIASAEPVTICVPAPYFTTAGALLKGSVGAQWQWYLEDILINGATSQNYLAQSTGYYKVKVKDIGGCESFSLDQLICVPAPTITLGSNNVLTASAGLSYQWYLDEIELPGANTQVYIAVSSGSYTVKVEDNNACENISMPISILITNTYYAMDKMGLMLYPNPVTDLLSLVFKNNASGLLKIELLDLTGIVIQSSELMKSSYEFETELSLKNIAGGSYLIRVTDEFDNQSISKLNKVNH